MPFSCIIYYFLCIPLTILSLPKSLEKFTEIFGRARISLGIAKTSEMFQNRFRGVSTIFQYLRKSLEIFRKLQKRFKTVFEEFFWFYKF